MKSDRTLILSGMGLNCEKETKYACMQSGGSEVDIIHTLRFLNGEVRLSDYHFLIFIGGFLDGDYLGSARVGANRFKFGNTETFHLREELRQFIDQGKLLLGICNGFQLLVKLGLLPDENLAFESQTVSLTRNKKGIFEDRWVNLQVDPASPSIFTKGIERLYLPIRHGEGRIVVTDTQTQNDLVNSNLITMKYADKSGVPTSEYPDNPNGSWNNVAAISNRKGNILGMMPHPEAYNHYTNHPNWTRIKHTQEDGEGLLLFKNAYKYLSEY